MKEAEHFCELGKTVIGIEAEALIHLQEKIGPSFSEACHILLHCQGRTVLLGIGKSGHIAKKIAATFASTGTPAFYVHPAEANHGDIGMIVPGDVTVALSYSGETRELLNIIPVLRDLQVPLIAITGNLGSTLGRTATVALDVSVKQEACLLGLAPTASTTAALAMGDALAIVLQKVRGFSCDDFARAHPGGMLGRRLRLPVQDLMHTQQAMPVVSPSCFLSEALVEMTKKSLGITTVVEHTGKLLGVFTDGDLRRTIDNGYNIHETAICEVMTEHGITVDPTLLAEDALKLMHQHKITALVVVNQHKILMGVVHMHDLLRAGIV